MKNFGIIIVMSSVLMMVSCQETVDPEAEKKAIIDVINAETQAYTDYDFEKVISYYTQDSLNFRLSTGPDGHVFLEGWCLIEALFKDDLIDGNPILLPDTRIKVEKDNYRIKVYENTAYVLCTEKWTYTLPGNVIEIDSRQIRFMEKVDGEWKIAFLSFIGISGYEAEEELEELGIEFNKVL